MTVSPTAVVKGGEGAAVAPRLRRGGGVARLTQGCLHYMCTPTAGGVLPVFRRNSRQQITPQQPARHAAAPDCVRQPSAPAGGRGGVGYLRQTCRDGSDAECLRQ